MHQSRWVAGLIVFAIGATTWVHAQQAGADPMAQIKTKEALADADRSAITAFLTQAIGVMKGDSPAAAQDAKAKINAAYDGGTKGYREVFASTAIQLIAQNYKTPPDMAAVQLVALLGALNVAEANATLIEALKDQRVGVRGAAAGSLRQLHERLAQAGAGFHGAALNALKEAAKKEPNRGTLRLMYAAIRDIGTAPDPKGCVTAFVEILDARAKAQGAAAVPAFAADDVAFRALNDLASQLDDDQKKRLADSAGAILRVCVREYATTLIQARPNTPQIDERDNVAAVLEDGEALLKNVLAPTTPPNMKSAFTRSDAGKLKDAWKLWAELIKAKTGKDYSID